MVPHAAWRGPEHISCLFHTRFAAALQNSRCVSQELNVEKKTALCTSSVAYQGGRKPQFQINYDLVVRSRAMAIMHA